MNQTLYLIVVVTVWWLSFGWFLLSLQRLYARFSGVCVTGRGVSWRDFLPPFVAVLFWPMAFSVGVYLILRHRR